MSNKDKYKFSINLQSSRIGKLIKHLPLFDIPAKLKKGFKEEIRLRDGLKLVVNEYKLKRDISIDFEIENAPLEFAFCLSGSMNVRLFAAGKESENIDIASGLCSIFYLPNSHGTIDIAGSENLKILSLHVSPDYLRNFFDDVQSEIPPALSPIFTAEQARPFIVNSSMTSEMFNAGSQILDNMFSGTPRNMFLEAKALELMTLIISQISAEQKQDEYQISDSDRQKIIHLEQYITGNINSLPSLMQLAEQASMTHTKLNKLFKTIFGQTVFFYVREKRIDKAKQLLLSDMNITEIAYELGYSSPAHFSREFADKAGMNPKAYQKKLRKDN